MTGSKLAWQLRALLALRSLGIAQGSSGILSRISNSHWELWNGRAVISCDGLTVEAADFVLATSGKKDDGKDMP